MSEKNRLQEYCQKKKIPMPIYQSSSIGEAHCLQWSASVTVMINNKNVTMDTIVSCHSKVSAEKQAAIMMLDHIRSLKNKDLGKLSKPSKLSRLRDTTKISITSTHKSKIPIDPVIKSNLSDSENENEDKDEFFGNAGNFVPKHDLPLTGQGDNVINDFADNNAPVSESNMNQIKHIFLIDLENKPAFKQEIKPNSLYIGFLNSIHNSVSKYKQWHKCESDNVFKELDNSKNYLLLYLVDGGTPDLVDHFMTVFAYPTINFIASQKICPSITIVSGDHAGWCTRSCFEKILRWNNLFNININNAASFD